MRTARRLALALLPLLASLPISATSYVPMTDEALVDQAPVIAVVEVQGSGSSQDSARPFTGYRVRVERVLKGAMASGLRITVRVPGGARSDGLKLRIWGAPRFAPGERALLFLSPRMDGAYDIAGLMLGAFHELRAGGHRLAVRHLSETRAIARQGETLSAEPFRDFDRFVRWVAARARGMRVRADYQVVDRITEDFTLLEDPDDGYNVRWFDFDDGASVPWYAHQSGQLGVTGGGFTEFQTALAAWNNDPGSNVGYTYAGTTTDTSGLIEYDTLNTIIFDDPNGELPSFSCSSGGVLAYGGPWYYEETTSFQGTLYHRIANADVVINNGLTCFFQHSLNASAAAAELFAHELGHTLGIGHSCGDGGGPDPGCLNPTYYDAMMRAFIHNDGRGAALNSDDRAASGNLYPAPPSPTDFHTLTSCRLLDTRNPNGNYGGPALQAGQLRTFAAAGQCGIPATAVSLSLNVTVVSPTGNGYLTLFPADRLQPTTGTVNFSGGQTRSNNTLLLLSATDRTFVVFPSVTGNGTVDVLVDVNGYFE
ncbi:MAG: hypothetical protein ACJ76J_17070 [Thermoanaerobaculia bacterium]